MHHSTTTAECTVTTIHALFPPDEHAKEHDGHHLAALAQRLRRVRDVLQGLFGGVKWMWKGREGTSEGLARRSVGRGATQATSE